MKKTLLLITILSSFFLGGCSVHGGIAADTASTYASISSGSAEELNPLLPKSAVGASLTSAALKYASLSAIKRYSPENCKNAARTATALGYGAGINNLLIMSEVDDNTSILLALITGLITWHNSQKSAAKYCKSNWSLF